MLIRPQLICSENRTAEISGLCRSCLVCVRTIERYADSNFVAQFMSQVNYTAIPCKIRSDDDSFLFEITTRHIKSSSLIASRQRDIKLSSFSLMSYCAQPVGIMSIICS